MKKAATRSISRAELIGHLAKALPGPDDITRTELPNGIRILVRTNRFSPSVVINGYLSAGGLFDPEDKLGLSDFTTTALMRGTEKYDFQAIFDRLESVGASLGFNGATHTTGFGGRALAEDLPLLMGTLAEVLRYPVFPSEEVSRLQAQLLTGLALRQQDTGEMASLNFDQIVYRGHPYSRPEDGYPETIQAITPSDLVAFHRSHIGPNDMVIVVVGAVEAQEVIDLVSSELGDWENADQPHLPVLPPVKPLDKTEIRRVPIPGKYQTDLVVGLAGPARSAPDFIPAVLGNHILGQFGLMGRLGDVVREKAGLAYHISSSLAGGSGPGPWTVTAGVNPANVDQALDLIRQELVRFTTQPVLQEELADSQANFIGRLPLSLESNSGVAGALLRLERYELGLDYYWRYPDMIRAVTPEQVLQAARHYLDLDRLAIVIAGPQVVPAQGE